MNRRYTQQKKLSRLDIIRVDIFLEETYAVRFENILQLCNLNLDGIGASNGTIVPGSGARMIKCIDQFGEDFSSYIVRAVSFMRDHWVTENNPLEELRDDMIFGLTTLFVFLDKAGSIENGTDNGLNGKKKKVESLKPSPGLIFINPRFNTLIRCCRQRTCWQVYLDKAEVRP